MNYKVRNAASIDQTVQKSDWGTIKWLANSDLTGCRNMTVGRVTIKKGCCNPRHGHSNCREALYLLSGKLEHSIGDEWVTLEPGDCLVVDAGINHHARSVGEVDADMIVVYDAGRREFQPAE